MFLRQVIAGGHGLWYRPTKNAALQGSVSFGHVAGAPGLLHFLPRVWALPIGGHLKHLLSCCTVCSHFSHSAGHLFVPPGWESCVARLWESSWGLITD